MTMVFYWSNVVYMKGARNNTVHKENVVIQKCLLSPSETRAGTWRTEENRVQCMHWRGSETGWITDTQEPILGAMRSTLIDVCIMWPGSAEKETAQKRQQNSTGDIWAKTWRMKKTMSRRINQERRNRTQHTQKTTGLSECGVHSGCQDVAKLKSHSLPVGCCICPLGKQSQWHASRMAISVIIQARIRWYTEISN